ncbi:hypothetical protein [Pseudaestuariivita rosea]|uniref:hypothetical protein n=1 Tax=Pseudaestuariivita rosea TaxID=2763263 RepID=UPI001ABADD82|nr:hypothetical protein [Pseudaestuariivita rosea]
MRWVIRIIGHILIVAVLTIVTQIGGIAWLLALLIRRRLLAFLVIYTALSIGAAFIAPQFGRQPLRCFGDAALTSASPIYCALNRHYVTPEMADVANDLAGHMAARFPGAQTLTLDGSFPFFDGFPLAPHLSHDDGEKLDLAFYYADNRPPSTIGYFAFEDGATNCRPVWPTLRWDMGWLKPLWREATFDAERTKAALEWLAADPRVSKILLEPHLKISLGLTSPKIRFQGCLAARHDDHIHFQL